MVTTCKNFPTLIGQNELYRGITETLRDIDNVYTSWTTSLRTAEHFAGPTGYILTINLDEIPLAEETAQLLLINFYRQRMRSLSMLILIFVVMLN